MMMRVDGTGQEEFQILEEESTIALIQDDAPAAHDTLKHRTRDETKHQRDNIHPWIDELMLSPINNDKYPHQSRPIYA